MYDCISRPPPGLIAARGKCLRGRASCVDAGMRLPPRSLGLVVGCWLLALVPVASHAAGVILSLQTESEPAKFAANALEAALRARGESPERRTLKAVGDGTYISFVEATDLKTEAFDLQVQRNGPVRLITVRGGGPGGVMYGGL